MNWALYAIAAVIAFGALIRVHDVASGKKKDDPPFVTVAVTATDAAIAVVLVLAAIRLS